MRLSLWLTVLAAAAAPMGAAADPGISTSMPRNSSFELSMPQLDNARVRPRVYYRPRPRSALLSAMPIAAQFHFGFFNPTNDFSTGFNGGFRVGPQLNPYLQIGVDVDWWHHSDNTVLDLGEVHVPGSVASEELILSESSANLVPFLFFVQVNLDANAPVIPYAGFGTGYEWLSLAANNYLTGESYDEIFGGFGWQVWGGAGLQLDPRMRLNAEVFFNSCEVGSEVVVDIEGYGTTTVRDVIKVDGVGMRLGACWLF